MAVLLMLAGPLSPAWSQGQAQTPAPPCRETLDGPPEAVIAACDAHLATPNLDEAETLRAHLVRATMLERTGDLRRSIEDLSQVIRKRTREAALLRRRARLLTAIGDDDRAIADLSEAIKLEPLVLQPLFDRAELFRKRGDRRRAYLDYGAVLKLDPDHGEAAAQRRQLAREIEKAGALMAVAPQPSFDCAGATRAVEKAICADIELSQLDREIAGAFQAALAAGRPPAALKAEQESFLATRNMAFGQAGYDLKTAMTKRLDALRRAVGR